MNDIAARRAELPIGGTHSEQGYTGTDRFGHFAGLTAIFTPTFDRDDARDAFLSTGGDPMKTRRMFFGALAISLAAGSQAMAGGSIPLPAGNFSLTVSGSESSCSSSTSCVVLNIIEAGATVRDSKGNGCGTHVAVVNNSPPGSLPPQVATITHVFKLTGYDPATGIGDQALTEYFEGSCNGATFVPTGNPFLVTTGVLHFAVSEGGNRIDNVVTSLNVEGNPATGFSLTFTERSQSSQNQQ